MPRWTAQSKADVAAVRDQLDRIVSSPLFRNSKRNTALLQYVVDQTLLGHAESLKERTIGVEVFGREPGYDSASDHIVRSTAGDIRRRLAQYYQDRGHAGELRIDMAPGSYVPSFEPAGQQTTAAAGDSALDAFWRPVIATNNPVLLCVGSPGLAPPFGGPESDVPVEPPKDRLKLYEVFALESEKVSFSDAVALAMITGWLGTRGVRYRIAHDRDTSLSDLRQGPTVLLGALNNEWGIRLAEQLRFTFGVDLDARICSVADARLKRWTVDFSVPFSALREDYGIITRLFDHTTGQTVVLAAGLTMLGTRAAGEFLTNPEHMETVAASAPEGWDRGNMQLVFATSILRGSAAPPHVVDMHCW